MQEGIVEFYNKAKGFGMIKSSETGHGIFVYSSGLIDEIREADRVKYDTKVGKKGLNAINVFINLNI